MSRGVTDLFSAAVDWYRSQSPGLRWSPPPEGAPDMSWVGLSEEMPLTPSLPDPHRPLSVDDFLLKQDFLRDPSRPGNKWDEVTANVARYLLRNPNEWGDLGWEEGANYASVMREMGHEGLRATLGEVGLGIAEPGPGDFARALGALFAMPLGLQRMLGKRIHPSMVGADSLPYQMYHGTGSVFEYAGDVHSPARVGRGHHMTRTGEYADTYAGQIDVGPGGAIDPVDEWLSGQDLLERPHIRMESPMLRRPLVRAQPMPVTRDEINTFATRFMDELSLRGGSAVLPDNVRASIAVDVQEFVDNAIASGAINASNLNQFVNNASTRYADWAYRELGDSWAGVEIVNDAFASALYSIGIDGYIDPRGVGRSVPFTHRGVPEASGEFVSFMPDRDVVRAAHPEDAIRWLLRQPDLTSAERIEIAQAIQDLGLEDLFDMDRVRGQ